MTAWGGLLLCVYVALGVGSTTWRKAVQLGVAVTALVVVAAMVSYGALR
jgi:hypothetical protein